MLLLYLHYTKLKHDILDINNYIIQSYMNILERVPYNSVEEQAEPQRMKLSELIENKSNIEIDQSMLDMLKIMV